MNKQSPLEGLINFIIWVTGILVGLAVGFGMISKTLTVPYVPASLMIIAGWIVVILILLGVLFKIIDMVN